MKRIKVIVVDDEPIARRNLEALLRGDPDVEIIGLCAGGAEAVKLIRKTAPDLLFLDIQMPEIDGFAVLKRIGATTIPAIVFVTAHDQYALSAFEAQALDYLLKPFSDERFATVLERAKLQIRQQDAADLNRKLHALLSEHKSQTVSSAPAAPASRFLIKEASRVFFVKAEEIDWVEAADYYVNLHVGSKSHLLRETMAEMENSLDPEMFLRIHRSAIINVRQVKEVQTRPGGEYVAVMRNGTHLKLSRGRREQLESLLQRLS
jgi:two-component system LytT family response regulator